MSAAPGTYRNPVHPGYLADPFVWRHDGIYYAIGTGEAEAAEGVPAGAVGANAHAPAGVFPLLRSPDLVAWEALGPALIRPPSALGGEFWAPAVAEADGVFHCYYSVGPGHQLRVALSDRPLGPFRDHGALMPSGRMPFAIDPHPFRDSDGTWYLFYARDFLDATEGNRAGTALAVDRLATMTRLAGEERVVLRARHDWQRFQAQRPMYGQVWDWHTLEGPCVTRHDGRYWCFFSGACYGNPSYGVDYAVADGVLGPYSDAGGEHGPRILRTVPGRAHGPGHNSLVVAPDGSSEFVVYHAWDPAGTARRMCLDRLRWTAEGPRCDGPTWTPQVMPGAAHAT